MTLLGRLATVAGGLALATLVVWAVSRPDLEPAWVSAGAASTSALFTVITAGIAIASLTQIRRDSRETSRPMVVADLEKAAVEKRPGAEDPPEGEGFQDLVIQNVGKSVARNVRVAFDPELPGPEGSSPAVDLLLELFSKPRTLVPRTAWRTLYHGPTGLPTHPEVDVVITYDDGRGKDYRDRFTLDVRAVATRTSVLIERHRGGPVLPIGRFGAAPPMAPDESLPTDPALTSDASSRQPAPEVKADGPPHEDCP